MPEDVIGDTRKVEKSVIGIGGEFVPSISGPS